MVSAVYNVRTVPLQINPHRCRPNHEIWELETMNDRAILRGIEAMQRSKILELDTSDMNKPLDVGDPFR